MQKWMVMLLSTAMIACTNNTTTTKTAPDAPPVATEKATTPPAAATATHPLMGNWVGMLGSNKLNVQLLQINGNSVTGRSVAAGNYRNITGTLTETANGYTLQLREPGDDKYDGIFDITIRKEGMVCEGKWTPFDTQLKTKPFTLSKKEYVYQPNVGLYPDASTAELEEEDVLNISKSELRIMRNSIYARHGYSFKMKDMRELFDGEDWYIPMNTDVRNKLTAIEQKNEALLKRVEKYAAEYYDSYGR